MTFKAPQWAEETMDFSARVYFVGDPHGLTNQVARDIVTQEPLPAGVVFLGDFDLERTFHREVEPLADAGVEVWWICGDHDTDKDLYYFRLYDNNRLSGFNLHGRVAEIAGLRVACLGGVFKGRIWMPPRDAPNQREALRWRTRNDWLGGNAASNRWRGGLPLHLRDAIWPEDYVLLKLQRADVLVCHEAPSSHKFGFVAIDALAQAMGASMIVHGHHHTDYDARPSVQRLVDVDIWN